MPSALQVGETAVVTATATGGGGHPQYTLAVDTSIVTVITPNPVTFAGTASSAEWTIQAVGPGTAMISTSLSYETRTCQDGDCFFHFTSASSPSVAVDVVARAGHLLDVTSDPLEGGEVAGAGSYADGETVSVTAIPAEGLDFRNWSGDCTDTGPCAFANS